MSEELTIRKAVANDVPFIMSGWLNSWRTSKHAGVIPNHLYYDTTRTLIEDLIARGAILIVAEVQGVLLGFAAGEVKDGKTVLHYCYCKDVFHRTGVEDKLIAALPGEKPGWFTFYQNRIGALKEWRWAPEIARRKTL